MIKVEFLWSGDCPHREEALWLLRDVLRGEGVLDEIELIEVADLETAERARFTGSPTIRINDTDVDPAYVDSGDYAPGCRVYQTDRGPRSIPERRWIEVAVHRATAAPPPGPASRERT